MSDLNAERLEKLLERLDGNPEDAAGKYEELRLKLIKCFIWRGCLSTHADGLADITLDRIAKKIAGGVKIENLDAYACEVSRYVWMEHRRRNKEDTKDDGEMPEQKVEPDIPEDPDERLRCLRKCLSEVVKDDAEKHLIVGYYQTNPGEKIKETRRKLAEKFDLTMNNLKQKALRLRKRLEDCINDCVRDTA